ncbi:hypothetical protein GDO86_000780 [Hymenochirus boettgeri]|uniref:Uncharacterized protein n=1 Tax=Hymenochirus boettgeri TaxID=247094 RepID=A0A8T2KEF6_9PIPI|nr:hypothetical protein GDO86_000780 [Hymenochirus boettgeri]
MFTDYKDALGLQWNRVSSEHKKSINKRDRLPSYEQRVSRQDSIMRKRDPEVKRKTQAATSWSVSEKGRRCPGRNGIEREYNND